jgi:hypothetical protein
MSHACEPAESTAAPPRRCFCQVAIDELAGWARKKYLDRIPTLDLLRMAQDPRQREAIGIVALLDVPDDEVIRMMTPITQAGCNILVCRDHLKAWLADMLDLRPA